MATAKETPAEVFASLGTPAAPEALVAIEAPASRPHVPGKVSKEVEVMDKDGKGKGVFIMKVVNV